MPAGAAGSASAVPLRLLMACDAREPHHRHPDIPGNRLHGVPGATPDAVQPWRWTRAAKRVPPEVFPFENRDKTGLAA